MFTRVVRGIDYYPKLRVFTYVTKARYLPMQTTPKFFYADKDPIKVEEVINKNLERIDKWDIENQMIRNHSKYQAMVMGRREEVSIYSFDVKIQQFQMPQRWRRLVLFSMRNLNLINMSLKYVGK